MPTNSLVGTTIHVDYLTVTHNHWLVLASLCVALIAGFTGLSLTRGLSARTDNQKKLSVAFASVALGGGIWSMHFVAMLGMQLPIAFHYDAAITLASALVAILVVGVALLTLHFYPRTPLTLALAGAILGLGIVAMHYLGMAGLQMARAVNAPVGVVLAVLASCGLNVAAVAIAYGRRSQRNILIGTVCFGVAVVSVHFIAMAGTRFVADANPLAVGPQLSNDIMALGVILTSFVLCGAFLLSGVTFLGSESVSPPEPVAAAQRQPASPVDAVPPAQPGVGSVRQIPYEADGKTWFIDVQDVVAVRAEGHHTQLYTDAGKRHCIWSITEAEKRLTPSPLMKAHRSYLVNPDHIRGFERQKDSAVCYFETPGLTRVPVSRSRLSEVRAALGV